MTDGMLPTGEAVFAGQLVSDMVQLDSLHG